MFTEYFTLPVLDRYKVKPTVHYHQIQWKHEPGNNVVNTMEISQFLSLD